MRLRPTHAAAIALVLAACGKSDEGGLPGAAPNNPSGPAAGRKVTIGLSMDTLKEERWQRDRDFFVSHAEKLGAKVLVQAANSDDALQNAQAENLLTQGVDVLVVVPHNATSAATIVASAHKSRVPVIAYDRLIRDSDVDLYVASDVTRIGELQAEYAVKHRPKGNYVLIGGAPTDNNAHMLREGQMKVLKPYVDRGDIKIVADQWAKDWAAVEALKITENALTRNNNQVDAIVASNDGTAGGAIQALAEQKLAGKVLVTGQDADLAACQRIVAGTQTMTIFKSIKTLAETAAEAAVALAQKKPVSGAARSVNNGRKDVPAIMLDPTAVDKANLATTVIAEGYQKLEQVYKDVPKEQWPAKK